jgi:hypothetical protein
MIQKLVDNESRVLLGKDGGVHIFAFHRLAGDVYASGFPGKEHGTYHTWFFRITENRLSLLFMRESNTLDAIAAKTGVQLWKDIPLSPRIRGSEEKERAFIDELVGSGKLIPATNCRFVK